MKDATSPRPDNSLCACNFSKEADRNKRRYDQILEYSFEEIYIFDADTRQVIETSQGALKNLGYTLEEMQGMILANINGALSKDVCDVILDSVRTEGSVANFKSFHVRKDGSHYDVDVKLQYIPGDDPVFISFVTDITERNQYENELKTLAFRDPGTDLYNRRFFLEQLEGTINHVNRIHSSIGLILIDMDDFSNVNNKYGHLLGDKIIINFCDKIKKVFGRKTDVVARYGGDEFVVMCIDNTEEHLVAKCNELSRLFNEPYYHEGNEIVQTASIGICLRAGKNHAITSEELIGGADSAMYEIKRLGKNSIKVCKNDLGS